MHEHGLVAAATAASFGTYFYIHIATQKLLPCLLMTAATAAGQVTNYVPYFSVKSNKINAAKFAKQLFAFFLVNYFALAGS